MPSVLRQLTNGLEEGVDFVAVSEKSWEQLHHWCDGPMCPTSCRPLAAEAAASGQISLMYLVQLTVCTACAWHMSNTGNELQRQACWLLSGEPAQRGLFPWLCT